MYKFFPFLFLLCIITHFSVDAQTLPKEGSVLNYRLVGFSCSPVEKAGKYILEITPGIINTEDSFKKSITQTFSSKNNKIIAEVPAFGRQYTWRISYTAGSSAGAQTRNINITKGGLHHFSTFLPDVADTNRIRLKVLKTATKYNDAYVFMDGCRALYNMRGAPVWFLPATDRFEVAAKAQTMPNNIKVYVQEMPTPAEDLKLTPQGTITFLYNGQAYEVAYDGSLLWKAPDDGKVSGDHTEYYHREFTRLANGHYMISGNRYENVCRKWVHTSVNDSSLVLVSPNEKNTNGGKQICNKTEFGTIIEYDAKGNVVWSWCASKYFIDKDKGRDLYYCEMNNRSSESTVHDNSFFFDEKDSVIYISYRNVSRIVKIRYPSGEVLAAYGGDAALIGTAAPNALFCYQHCCRYSKNGYLYLYNNNVCHLGDMPRVEVLAELQGNKNLHPIWSYECPAEGIDRAHHESPFTSGGSVSELADGSMFVCMGRDFSKVFIVNREKEVVWAALPQMLDITDNKWDNIPQYRAAILTNKQEIERMVYDAELK